MARPDLAPGVAALPRLPEATAAATSINARLAALDAEALAFQGECVTGAYSDYFRWVKVPLSSDTFVTLLVFEDAFCTGAAHPGSTLMPLTFDRQTGEEADPMTWLPAALAPKDPHNLADLAPLTELYIATEIATAPYPPDPECHDLLRQQPHGFDLWPDAAAPGLVLVPTGLAHVFTSCENPVTLPLATLRRLGFAPALLDALAP